MNSLFVIRSNLSDALNRRDAEAQRVNALTESIIGAAIEVHRTLGPGLLESAYESCLACELDLREVSYERQKTLPLYYKGRAVDCCYVMDMLVGGLVVVELKTVEKLLPIHDAQLLTYLRLTNSPVGLLLNFKESTLLRGLKRMVNNLSENSAPPRLCGSKNSP